jgi:hypothetical protein
MAYLLSRSLILHVPKTGSDWVRAACQAAVRSRIREIGPWHCDLATAKKKLAILGIEMPPVGTFVRHPLTWYRSAWCYWMETGRFPREDNAPRVESDDFSEFVRNCLHVEPSGYVCSIFERFVGPTDGCVSFVGRQERLVDDLVEFLRVAGEDFDEERLRKTEPRNVRGSRPDNLFPGYSHDLAQLVLSRETRVIRRFYSSHQVCGTLLR